MLTKPRYDWTKALAEQAERRAAAGSVTMTPEQRAELVRRQRDARVNTVMRSGIRARRSV